MVSIPEPPSFRFKRVTTEYYHARASHEVAALTRVRLEPGRYQEGFHEEEWFAERSDGWYPIK